MIANTICTVVVGLYDYLATLEVVCRGIVLFTARHLLAGISSQHSISPAIEWMAQRCMN